MKKARVRITVIRRLKTEDIFGGELPEVDPSVFESRCPVFKEGDTFISEDGKMPEGFCSWAWHDLHRDVTHLRFGGGYPLYKKKGITYTSCTDGSRPVIFKLEKLEDQ